MINSIGSQLTGIGLGAIQTGAERPTNIPDPAVQVTALERAESGRARSSTAGDSGMREYPEPPKSSLEKALESVNDSLRAWATGMRFEMDDDAQRLVVSIVDSTSGDVVKKIPSDVVLQVARMITQLQGAAVDTQA